MTKPTDDLVRILLTGGSVSMPSTKPTADLVRLATVAKSHGGHLTLLNCKKPTSDLVTISLAGKGHVTFHFE